MMYKVIRNTYDAYLKPTPGDSMKTMSDLRSPDAWFGHPLPSRRTVSGLTHTVVLACASVLSVSCGDDPAAGGTDGPSAPFLLWAIDIGNDGAASDIEVRIDRPASNVGVSEYRVYLLDDAGAENFDEAMAASAQPRAVVSVPADDGVIDVRFPADAQTVSGAAVTEGGTYAVRAQSIPVATGASAPLSTVGRVTLERTNIVRTLVGPLAGGTGGMETDAAGNIYAADFGVSLDGPPGTVVYKITPAGEASVWANGLVGASGNAFDSQGNLLQSNISAGRVSKIDPAGQVTTFATGLNGGPVGIAVAPGDTLYVVNCGQNQIHRVDPDGLATVWTQSSLFNCPNGITLADDGNFYVANFGNGDVLRVTPSGVTTRLATLPGNNNGHIPLWKRGSVCGRPRREPDLGGRTGWKPAPSGRDRRPGAEGWCRARRNAFTHQRRRSQPRRYHPLLQRRGGHVRRESCHRTHHDPDVAPGGLTMRRILLASYLGLLASCEGQPVEPPSGPETFGGSWSGPVGHLVTLVHDGAPVPTDHFIVYSEASSPEARAHVGSVAESVYAELVTQLDVSRADFDFLPSYREPEDPHPCRLQSVAPERLGVS